MVMDSHGSAWMRTRTAVVLALVACGSLLARAQDRQQSGGNPGWPCVAAVDPSYVETAEGSGGRVLMFHPSELGAPGSAAVMAGPTDHDETVVRIVGRLEEGVHEFEVPIDSTIESVNFFVSLQCLQVVEIVGPSGDELRSTEPGVSDSHQFEAIRAVTVARPAPGRWTVTVAGRGLLFLVVQARSGLSLGRLTFLDPGRQFEVEGHVLRLPEAHKPQRIEISVSGVDGPVGFRLMSSSAATIQTLTLDEEGQDGARRTYRGEVTPGSTRFRLAATGVDSRGFAFQRVDPRLLLTAP